jgi:hypothetical protein
MIYAWGDSASPEALGAALLSARCLRAMHLDMNSGHSGFEFYNVIAPDEARLPSGPRANFRFEGSLPELPGYLLRARKGVTAMGMALPRYIHPDPRDYFYLTLKPGIETSAVPSGLPRLSSADLPHAGWPPAFARTQMEGARVLRIDPHRAVPSAQMPAATQQVLAELRGPAPAGNLDDFALYQRKEVVGVRYEIGAPPADAEVLLRGLPPDKAPSALAALGLDDQGLLVYVEGDGSPGQLTALLHKAGARAALALPSETRLGLRFREGVLEIDGRTRLKEGGVVLSFVARTEPAVEVIFADTKPMPYSRWAQLQDQRVRYFRTSDPSTKAPAGALREGEPGDGG